MPDIFNVVVSELMIPFLLYKTLLINVIIVCRTGSTMGCKERIGVTPRDRQVAGKNGEGTGKVQDGNGVVSKW